MLMDGLFIIAARLQEAYRVCNKPHWQQTLLPDANFRIFKFLHDKAWVSDVPCPELVWNMKITSANPSRYRIIRADSLLWPASSHECL